MLVYQCSAHVGAVNGGLQYYIKTCIHEKLNVRVALMALFKCLGNNIFCCLMKWQPQCATQAHPQLPICGIEDIVFQSALAIDTWIIEVSQLYTVNLTFSYFHLPFSGDHCIKSKMQVAEIDFSAHVHLINYYCGQREPWSVYKAKESHSIHVSMKSKHPLPAGYGFMFQYQAMDKQWLNSIAHNMVLLQYLQPAALNENLHTIRIKLIGIRHPSLEEKRLFVHVMVPPVHHACLQATQAFADMTDAHEMTLYDGPGLLSPVIDINTTISNCQKHKISNCNYTVCFTSFHGYLTYANKFKSIIKFSLHSQRNAEMVKSYRAIQGKFVNIMQAVQSPIGQNYLKIFGLLNPESSRDLLCMVNMAINHLDFSGMTSLYEETSMPCQYGGLYVYIGTYYGQWKTLLHVCSNVRKRFNMRPMTYQIGKITSSYKRILVVAATFSGYTHMEGDILITCPLCVSAQYFNCEKETSHNDRYFISHPRIARLFDDTCFQFVILLKSDFIPKVGSNRSCQYTLYDEKIALGPIHLSTRFEAILEGNHSQKILDNFNATVKTSVEICSNFPMCGNSSVNSVVTLHQDYSEYFNYSKSVAVTLSSNNAYNPFSTEIVHVQIRPHFICYNYNSYNISTNTEHFLVPFPIYSWLVESYYCNTYIPIQASTHRKLTIYVKGFGQAIVQVVESGCFVQDVTIVEHNVKHHMMFFHTWVNVSYLTWTTAFIGSGKRIEIDARGNCENFTIKLTANVQRSPPLQYEKHEYNRTIYTR